MDGIGTGVVVALFVLLAQGGIAGALTASAAPMLQAKDAVEVTDQPVTNTSITVATVSATKDGWIVVHLDEGGSPGKVLGQTAVKAGDNKNVVVTLSEAVPVGRKLWPMLHIDAGTIGTYEFPGADAPVSVNGMVIMKQISVTAATSTPGTLPTTGGTAPHAGLLAVALALLAVGSLLVLRTRPSRVARG